MVRRTFVALSLLYAAASIAMALMAAFAVGEWYSVQERALVALATTGGAVLIVAGLRVADRWRPLGALAVVAGTVPLAFGFWWTMLVPAVAVAIVVTAVVWLVSARPPSQAANAGATG